MGLNGTSTLVNGKVAQSKTRGKAFIEELNREYGNEEANARKVEGVKPATNHGKPKKK